MPNRQTHAGVGVLAGVGVATCRARDRELSNMLLAAIGGGIGGYVGSRLPDVVEPPLSIAHIHDTIISLLRFFWWSPMGGELTKAVHAKAEAEMTEERMGKVVVELINEVGAFPDKSRISI